MENSEKLCPNCGKKMVEKVGRYGKYLACENYPQCKTSIRLDRNGNPVPKKEPEAPIETDEVCDLCGNKLVIRKGRYGTFYACSNFPECRFTKPLLTAIEAACPKCNSKILVRHTKNSKIFFSCERYPECDYSTWDMPLSEKCPSCGEPLLYQISKKQIHCSSCEYTRDEELKVEF